MIQSKITAEFITKDGVERKISVVFNEMDMSDELATNILGKIKECLPEVKKWTHGKVITDEKTEFEIADPEPDQTTIPLGGK